MFIDAEGQRERSETQTDTEPRTTERKTTTGRFVFSVSTQLLSFGFVDS